MRVKLANDSSGRIYRYYDRNEEFGLADFSFTVAAIGGAITTETTFSGPDITVTALLPQYQPTLDPGGFWLCQKTFLPVVKPAAGEKTLRVLPPGRYALKARVLLPLAPGQQIPQTVTSNTIEFRVTPPEGADADAAKLIVPEDACGFFDGIRGSVPDSIKELLRVYPESPYAVSARARVILDRSKYYWNTKRDHLSMVERREVAGLASDALEFVGKWPDMPLNGNLLLYCSRLQRIVGQKDKSAETLRRVLKDHPTSDACDAATRELGLAPKPPSTQASPPTDLHAAGALPAGSTSRPAPKSAWIELPATRRTTQPATNPATQ